MARIISAPLGEIRGKVGGNVFSRNKSGMTLRQHVKGVNRNSEAQARARANFSACSSEFGALPENIQSQWNGFASDANSYMPIRGTNQGQFTGAQAYQSLALIRKGNDSAPAVASSCVEAVADSEKFTYYGNIPFFQIGSSFFVSEYDPENPTERKSSIISFSANVILGKFTYTIGFDFPMFMPELSRHFVDENGQNIGLIIYMSTPVRQSGMRPKQDLYYVVHRTNSLMFKKLLLENVDVLSFTGLDIDGEVGIKRAGWAKFSLFACNAYGQMRKLSECYGQIDWESLPI
jgi:hypothetical protein